MLHDTTTFLIDKQNIQKIWIQSSPKPILETGTILLEVRRASLTSNNITYAVLGEQFRYWSFFPHGDGGILPVWGTAEVVQSASDQIEIGEKFYGFLPLATHLVVRPADTTDFGFRDGSAHRRDLPRVYNYYERIDKKLLTDTRFIDMYSLFQPLFATSFLLDIYCYDNSYFSANEIFVTSASSKTAIAFAYLIKNNHPEMIVSGITSEKNMDFCNRLKIYDHVYTYKIVDKIKSTSSCITDFAGNSKLLYQLQKLLLPTLKKSITIGLSHWDQRQSIENFPLKNELFFAPSHAKEKQRAWGGKTFKIRLDNALDSFINWASTWLEIRTISINELVTTYNDVASGSIDPNEAIIIELNKKNQAC